jgi:hypothetical protein
MAATMEAAAAACSGKGMLIVTFVTSRAYVASPIARFVGVEVVELPFAASRNRSVVSVVRVKAVVDVAVEAARTMEPRARAKKHPADEPIWPIVAVWRTIIRSVVKIPIGAHWRHSNADGYLSRRRRLRSAAEKGNRES